MYQSTEEQMKRQIAALDNAREKAMSDPNYARQLLEAVGSPTSPRQTSNDCKSENEEIVHAKSSTK